MKKIMIFGLIAIMTLLQADTALGLTDCVRVNQRDVSVLVAQGKWNPLGVYQFTAGATATVVLTREKDGSSTSADAVRFQKLDGSNDCTIDNSGGITGGCSGSYTTNVTWSPSSSGRYGWNPGIPGFDDGTHKSTYSADAGTPATATWSVSIPASGLYLVSASWTYYSTRAHHAPYCISGYAEKKDYIIYAHAETGGSITPSGDSEHSADDTPEYTIKAIAGYKIYDVLVDRVSKYNDLTVNADQTEATYTFEPLAEGTHTIEAVFAELCETNATSVSCGFTGSGNIDDSNDEDWYVLRIEERQHIKISSDVGGTDTRGWLLYPSNCAESFQIRNIDNDHNSTNKNFKMVNYLDPGLYYIVVKGYDGDTGTYTLTIECSPDQNDDCFSADTIACPGQVTSYIQDKDDLDYYRIDLPGIYPYLIEAYTTGYETYLTDTTGYLLSDTNGCVILDDYIDYKKNISKTDKNFHIEEQEVLPGTYYIRVRREAGSTAYPLQYSLNVNCRKATRIITATAGHDGYIDPPGDIAAPPDVTADHGKDREFKVEVDIGDSETFNFYPDAGYYVKEVIVDGVVQNPTPESYTFTDVTETHTIYVNFAVQNCLDDCPEECKTCTPGDCPDTCPDYAQPTECFKINQQSSGGSWNFIGSFDFIQGAGGAITIIHEPETLYPHRYHDKDAWDACMEDPNTKDACEEAWDNRKYTFADAVKLVNPEIGTIFVDNKDAGYSDSGGWRDGSGDTYYTDGDGDGNDDAGKGNGRYTYTKGATATFRPKITTAGTYQVYAWWPNSSKGNPNAKYCVEDHVGKAPLIEATAGDHGGIDPSGTVTVTPGDNQAFTMTPDPDYSVADILVDGVSVGAGNEHIFTKVLTDHTIEVRFDDYVSECGTDANNISCGATASGTLDYPGDWDYFRLNITEAKTVKIYTTSNPKIDTYGVLYDADCSDLEYNDDKTSKDKNFYIERVLLPGIYYIKVKHYNAMNGSGAYKLHVDCSSPPADVTVTVAVGEHGVITSDDPEYPINSNLITVPYGANIALTIASDDVAYCIKDVNVMPTGGEEADIEYLGEISSYTFEYLEKDWTITATFKICGEDCIPADPPIEIPGNGIDDDCVGGDAPLPEEVSCVDISNVPLNVQITSAPPLVMFLLDDSGSMAWSINMAGGQGLYENYSKMFDEPHGGRSSASLDDHERRYWQTQYAGQNKMYYNPRVTYVPWPDIDQTVTKMAATGNADPDTPLSDPTSARSQFDVSSCETCVTVNQRIDKYGDDPSIDNDWNILGAYDFSAGEVKVVLRGSSGGSNCADAVRFEKVDGNVDDIIIDNQGDANFSMSDPADWRPSTGDHGWNSSLNPPGFDPSDYDNSFYGYSGDTATWTATITEPGIYKVYASWTYSSSRDETVNYCIGAYDSNGNLYDAEGEECRQGMSATYVALHEDAGERITLVRAEVDGADDNDNTAADAIALVPTGSWKDGVAIENQPDVIIIDNEDDNFMIEGKWTNSSSEDNYGAKGLSTGTNGDKVTWMLDVPAGNYYVFVNANKKKDLKIDLSGASSKPYVWGYWNTNNNNWIDDVFDRAREAPYTVYSGSGLTEFTAKVDQMENKPFNPPFVDNLADWNTSWKAYWHKHWNGGKYIEDYGADPLVVKDYDDADTTWITDEDGLIISPPIKSGVGTWGWNGLDWVPLGAGNPGKVFSFTGKMEDGDPRDKLHRIPNSHYYDVDSDGFVWLVELIKGDANAPDPADKTDHINYYRFKDDLILDYGETDYVDAGELVLTDVGAVPAKIKKYIDETNPNSPVQKVLTYQWARQNFANWYTYYRTRMLTSKAAIGRVIADAEGLLMGLHTINNPAKDIDGMVTYTASQKVLPIRIEGADGLEDSRAELLDVLYGLKTTGSTPLRAGLERIGQYYSAKDDIAPKGLDGDAPWWDADAGGECQHAFVIAMTDGYYNQLNDPIAVGNADGPDEGNTDYDGPPYGDPHDVTLADIAMYYYETDLNEELDNEVPQRGVDKAEFQHMVTYGVSFGVSGEFIIDPDWLDCPPNCPEWPDPITGKYENRVDDLWHASINGRGRYMSAEDPQALVTALQELISEMQSAAGAGASVTTNTGQLKEGAVVFQGLFQSEGWGGDVIAYNLDSTGEVIDDPIKWSAAEELVKKTESEQDGVHERVIFTLDINESDFSTDVIAGKPFRITDTDAVPPVYGLSDILQNKLYASDKAKAKLVLNYIRGDHGNEMGGDPGGDFRARPIVDQPNATERTKLGDIIHSATLNVHYKDGKDDDGNEIDPYDVLYVGSNDGMLHAFDSGTGEELWAYIPNLVYPYLRELTDPNYTHKYFVDGEQYSRNIKDTDDDDAEDLILLVGSLKKGGKGIYCLNISDPKGDGGPSGLTESYAADKIANWEYPIKYEKDDDGNIIEVVNAGKLAITYENLSPKSPTKYEVGGTVKGDWSKAEATIMDIDTKTQVLTLHSIDGTFDIGEPLSGSGVAKIRDDKGLEQTIADADMGYSFSRPFIVDSYVDCTSDDIADCASKWVVFFGNGYESLRGHAVLYAIVLDSATGKIDIDTFNDNKARVYKIDTYPEEYTEETRECNGLSTPSLVDSDLDKKVDFAYAGDLLGNLWKFDLRDPDPAKWHVSYQHKTSTEAAPKPRPFFQAINADGLRQPITTQPEVVVPCQANQKGYFVSFGTGRYLGSDDFDDDTVQSVYGLWDWQAEWEDLYENDDEDGTSKQDASYMYLGYMEENKSTLPANCTNVNDDETANGSRSLSNQADVRLVQQVLLKLVLENKNVIDPPAGDPPYSDEVYPDDVEFEILSDNEMTWYSPKAEEPAEKGCHVGWYFDLPREWERITSDPVLRDGVAYFVSTIPSNTPCTAGGTSTFWGMNACSGGNITKPLFDINGDGILDENDLINIGTEENPILIAPTGINFDSYLYAPSFISVPGGGAMALLGGMTKDIITQLSSSGGYGVFYWKERD